MALNRLEWVQKEEIIDYHVLKWPTSHLHPRTRISVSGGFELKEQAGGAGASGEGSAQQEGIGPGFAKRSDGSRWRSGGLGQDGTAQTGLKDVSSERDGLTLSTHRTGLLERQAAGAAQETMSAAVQNAAQTAAAQTLLQEAARDTVHMLPFGQTVRRAGGRMREIIGRLRDIYLRQQKKTEAFRQQGRASQQREKRQGTRQVSREDLLSMQAENHYLLDSYDRNGQYSTLGKE